MREMLRDAGWRYAIGLTVLILILTSLPYTFAYLTAPDDLVFTGVQLNAADHAEYFAWMRAHEESFFIRNWMTPEPNEPVFFNLLWWAMAQFARLTGLDYAAVYQLLRWASALVFALVVYWFCRLCIEGRARRLLAFTLVMLAAGFGWALVAQKSLQGLEDVPYPLALYVPEANSFLAILGYPHFVIAAAHIVAVFALYLVALKRRQLRWAALAGVVALALGLQHAYDLVAVYGVLGAFVLALMLRERRILWFEIGALAALGVISVGPPAYFFLLTSTDPVWREILDQFVLINVWTPGPIQLVVLMGALLLLGFAGPLADLWRARRASSRTVRLARGWLALTLLVAALTLAASLGQSSGRRRSPTCRSTRSASRRWPSSVWRWPSISCGPGRTAKSCGRSSRRGRSCTSPSSTSRLSFRFTC
ncbi:MAG: hypothetical protein M5R40_29625 [Anaerolineae bacterium]|nr:hypothetical protein [Anaerolineae bacterium]